MAQVRQRQSREDVSARADDYLAYLTREWEALPALAAEWPGWQEEDRLDFCLEWPIREDRLAELTEWAEQGALSPQQESRYRRLLALIATYRPLLEELLGG